MGTGTGKHENITPFTQPFKCIAVCINMYKCIKCGVGGASWQGGTMSSWRFDNIPKGVETTQCSGARTRGRVHHNREGKCTVLLLLN